MDTSTDEAVILKALATLELKLTDLIRNGIAQIQQDHNRALLEQAKINGRFADRERVERLAIRLENLTQDTIAIHRQETVAAAERASLRAEIVKLSETTSSRSLSLATSSLAYIISAVIVLAGVIANILITHIG